MQLFKNKTTCHKKLKIKKKIIRQRWKGEKSNGKQHRLAETMKQRCSPWFSMERMGVGKEATSSSVFFFKVCTFKLLKSSPNTQPQGQFSTLILLRRGSSECPQNVGHAHIRETLGEQVTGVKRRSCWRVLVYVTPLNFTVLSSATWALPTPNTAKTSLLGVYGRHAESIGKERKTLFYSGFGVHQG